MAYQPLDIFQVVQKLRPGVHYNPNDFEKNAWIDALVAAINATGSQNYGGGLSPFAEYEYIAGVSGNYGPLTDAFFTPDDGTFVIYAFGKATSPTGAGTLDIAINSSLVGSLGSFPITLSASSPTGTVSGLTPMDAATYGNITVDRTVSGYSGPAGAVRVSLKAYKFA